VLSEFCKQLTSIRQSDVDAVATLPAVLPLLEAKVMEVTGLLVSECVFASWGNYDRNQFEHDCERHGIPYPFGPHINLKEEFARKRHIKRVGVPAALKILKLAFEGTHHRGADDAHNIARIFVAEFGANHVFKTMPGNDVPNK
jgi:inhibitor of KinA sporulation pathway (predicted exonuclease)